MSKTITFYFATGGCITLSEDCLLNRIPLPQSNPAIFALAAVPPDDADRLICDRGIIRIEIDDDDRPAAKEVILFPWKDDSNGGKYQNEFESVYVGKYGTIFIGIGKESLENIDVSELDKIDMIYRERNII